MVGAPRTDANGNPYVNFFKDKNFSEALGEKDPITRPDLPPNRPSTIGYPNIAIISNVHSHPDHYLNENAARSENFSTADKRFYLDLYPTTGFLITPSGRIVVKEASKPTAYYSNLIPARDIEDLRN